MTKLSIVLASLLDKPWHLAALIVGIVLGTFGLGQAVSSVSGQGALAAVSLAAPSTSGSTDLHYGPPAPELVVTTGMIGGGETLNAGLADQGIEPGVVDLIARELRGVFDFRYSKPGDQYRLIQRGDGEIAEFAYTQTSGKTYRLFAQDGQYVAERQSDEFVRREAHIAGVIQSTVYEAVKQLGESAQLAADYSQIFAWDVDFSRVIRPGDEFSIVYERLYKRLPGGGEEYVRPGKILAARYSGAAGEHSAVYFQVQEGRGGYYRPDGSAMARQFLAAPLRYSRISSRYTLARRHPITGRVRPHRGIDYAAKRGTPIWAVAAGKVIHKGWAGGLGRTVKVKHDNGYISYYGHLSRYGKSLRVGSKVTQKQVVGYVGSSGRATGPHLHFQVEKHGRLINPALVQTPAAPPVPDSRKPDFEQTRQALMAQLAPTSLMAGTEEAL